MITDVTDVARVREALKRANETLESAVAERTSKMQQSLDAMETLCYGIAHDFRAPVRALEGFTGMLISEYGKTFDDDAKLYASRGKLALLRMGELIDGVLSYGRLNHTLPELIPIHLRPLIDGIVQTLEPDITAKRAKINVQMTFPLVVGNPYLLKQVFTNLIANALKFTAPGVRPEISISAMRVEPQFGVPPSAHPTSHVTHLTRSAFHKSTTPGVRITVTDNGIGISPKSITRLFGMFQKLHSIDQYPGAGIGLAIVKRATELMNGQVGLFSEPGHGSSFWIELPSASRGE
jgi:signal transduction histidine kinase